MNTGSNNQLLSLSSTGTNISQFANDNIGTSIESSSMSNITTEIEHLSISSNDRNVNSPGSIINSGKMAQQSQPDNAESTALQAPAPTPIRKWRWPKPPPERRRKAVISDTNTSVNTNPLSPPEIYSDIVWKWHETPSKPTTPSPSPSPSPPRTLSLSHGFSKYWEDISDEELVTHIPSNIIQIWKDRIAQRRVQARAAGAEYERELEKELEEKYGAMLRCRKEMDGEAFVEGLLEMVEECGLAGVVRERGRKAFWKGRGLA
ncbi:hypothetical protein BCIN_13g02950 [Botrytis cinerea B05.10]|uniref:Uncharacterized protein n=1 Tax=Botryotinia fuckeliana (strain B05.10) TaxID=332648 RepID=A0A384K1Q0_BOTFB|nr:hypothetical protein BCIN_13g02950 [Botrytis cinerea B05.10]ATZ56457.1 hypothetical protein BCIN_13g02950 [Botrytis cinerea B05.10]